MKPILAIFLFLAIVIGVCKLKVYVCKIKTPNAPTWSCFL